MRREVDLGGVGNQQHPCTLARLGPRLAPVRHHDLLMTHLLVLEKPIRRYAAARAQELSVPEIAQTISIRDVSYRALRVPSSAR